MSRIVKGGQVIVDFSHDEADKEPRVKLMNFQIAADGADKKQAIIDLLNKTRGAIARHIKYLQKTKGDVA